MSAPSAHRDGSPPGDVTSATLAAGRPPAANLRSLAALFVVSRLYIYVVAALALRYYPKPPDYVPPRTILDWFLRWDALWYFDVAEHGYHFVRAGASTNVVFFPLYPWLLRAVSLNGLIDYRIAGLVVSWTGLWLACVGLWRLVAREWRDARLATWSVVFLLFGPVSFFWSTLYSESWFLPLTIGCLAAARDRRWWAAGLFGAAAAFTRFVGLALVVPLAWEWLQAAWTKAPGARAPRATDLLACGLPVTGFAAYTAVMWAKFGDPLLYFHAQQLWGRHFTWFWGLFTRNSYTTISVFYQGWFAGAVAVAFALMLIAVWRRMRTGWVLMLLTFSYIYISANGVEALPRYFSAVFPFYIAAALLVQRVRWLAAPLLASAVALEAVSVVLFVNGYWFT